MTKNKEKTNNSNTTRFFYKAVDKDLCGWGGFQYEVGKMHVPPEDVREDPWHWLHYSDRISTITRYGGDCPRILEVMPRGNITGWYVPSGLVALPPGCSAGRYYNTDRLEILRELPRNEILEVLDKENCPPWHALMFDPPFAMLSKWRNMRKGIQEFRSHVLGRSDLTVEEKMFLLPKHMHGRI